MRHNHEAIIRVAISSSDAAELRASLEPCGQRVWVSPTCCCDRHNVVGVPAKQLDVLVQDGLPEDGLFCLEAVRKAGKFDGAIRTRLCLRRICRGMDLGAAELRGANTPEGLCVSILAGEDRLWSEIFPRLRALASPTGARDIVMWHWSRYFYHLSSDVAESIASGFVIVEGTTITAANRQASNRLYQESVALGWKKLSLRERDQLGYPADAGHWQREPDVAQRRAQRAGFGNPTGCGAYTLTEASGIRRSGGQHGRNGIGTP